MKAGNKTHNGIEVPTNAKVCTDTNGNEFYVSSVNNDNGIWSATVKYIATNQLKLVSYSIIEKYL